MANLTETAEIILNAASQLEKLAVTMSATPGAIQDALQSAGLFGGKGPPGKKNYTREELEFDNTGKVAKLIFGILDSLTPEYTGKMDGTLTVTPKGGVTVNIFGTRAEEIQPKMQGTFGRPMSAALVVKKVLPAETMIVKWLVGVG